MQTLRRVFESRFKRDGPPRVAYPFLRIKVQGEATELINEVFILTTGPIERLGGMERFLQYVSAGFEERGLPTGAVVGRTLPHRTRHRAAVPQQEWPGLTLR